MTNKSLVLVDFSWCFHAFKYAYAHLDPPEGQKIGAVVGLCRLAETILSKSKLINIVFCMDSKDLKREEIHPEYKAGRVKDEGDSQSIKDAVSILSLAPRSAFAVSPQTEADDLIAFLSFSKKSQYSSVVVYSRDTDFWQLIPHGIQVASRFEGGSFKFITEEDCQGKFGVPLAHVLKYRAFDGDKSDNIPPAIPRIRREFVRKFVKVWADKKSFSEALGDECWDDKERSIIERVIEHKGVLSRNLQLMSLVKYKHPENRIPYSSFKTPEGGMDLIDSYQLGWFKAFLKDNGIEG